jgi:NAD(P)-dependent dehydrogenase (short-subunit alcohol dehydrogenase family)
MTDAWNTADIPSQAGRVAIVTGATSGLGLECARALAIAGAEAVIAARDMAKAARVMTDIHQTHPHADVECRQLDTARLAGALMQASASHKHLALKYQRLGRWTRCDRPLKGREAASDPRALKPIRDPRDEDVSAFALQDSDPPAIHRPS